MPDLPNPESRVEQYLANLTDGTTEIPKEPESRIEQYLDYLTKNGTVNYGTAPAAAVGMALIAKTIVDGKVTEWEFGDAGGLKIHICTSSEYGQVSREPTISDPDEKTLYLVPAEDGDTSDLFDEWAYVDGSWEKFGAVRIGSIDYTDLQNKPSINGVTLSGNKTSTDLNIPTAEDLSDLVDDWLDENISNPDSPPLDRSLSSSSAAAPADLVGEELTSIKEDLSNINDGIILSRYPLNNDIIFTTEDVNAGDILHYRLSLQNAKASFVGLYDENDVRIGIIGKASSQYSNLEYSGSFDVPANFSYAKFESASNKPTKVSFSKSFFQDDIGKIRNNLINPINYYPREYYVTGRGMKPSGNTGINSGLAYTDYIPVMPGDLIMRSECLASSTYGLCFYNLNKEQVSGMYSEIDSLCFVVPDGVYYIIDTINIAHTNPVFNIFRGDEIKILCGELYKKKVYTFGDSITWYDGKLFTWGKFEGQIAVGYQSYMRRAGMIVTNKGVSGDDITEINPDIHSTDFSDADYVTITFGANDSKDNVPIGTLSDIGSTFDTSTVYGALQDGIEYILSQKETVKIILMTPIKGTIYPNGEVKKEIVTAIKEIGNLYGLPVCDWYNQSGINKLNFGEYINDPDDNTQYMFHPTNKGFKRMADILIPFLKATNVSQIYQSF